MLYTKTLNGIKYIRQHWTERFYVLVYEGERCPRFYLPTYRKYDACCYIAWIIPLAPFVLLGMALYSAFWIMWKDLVTIISMWVEQAKLLSELKK
jgi:hypothetical protein